MSEGIKVTSDRITLERSRTPRELVVLREASVRALRDHCGEVIETFTCDDCTFAAQCAYAFDQLNTDGYCLGSK